jgi:abhydrolase domain-containing protein 13
MLDYVKKDDILKDTKLIVFGQSIGGAIAVDLVSRNEDQASSFANSYLSCHVLWVDYN